MAGTKGICPLEPGVRFRACPQKPGFIVLIMRSYNESGDLAFINHMHVLSEIASRLILPIVRDVTSSPPVRK